MHYCGPKHILGNMFNTHSHLACQNNITIGGRLVGIQWFLSNHHWRFLHLIMDESIRFYVARLQIKRNMKLQLRISQLCTCMDFVTMVSSSLGKQGKWVPCKHMYYVLQHVMFCAQVEIFISQLGVVMKFIDYWFVFLFLHRWE